MDRQRAAISLIQLTVAGLCVGAALFALPAWAAEGTISVACFDAKSPNDIVLACTAEIDAGENDPEALAALYHTRAIAFESLDERDLSLSDWGKVIALVPDNPWAYPQRGIRLYHYREYRRAIDDFTDFARLSPASIPSALFWRALSFEALGEIERAIADHDRIVELAPKARHVRLARAFAYMKVGEWDLAEQDIARERELLPEPIRRHNLAVEAVWAWGILAFAFANYDVAVALLKDSQSAERELWTYAAMVLNGDETDGYPRKVSAPWSRFDFQPDPDWPKPIIAALRSGTGLDDSSLSNDPRIRRERQVQWAFYRAIAALDAGDAAKSRALLEEAVALGPVHVIEYHFAKAELARLP